MSYVDFSKKLETISGITVTPFKQGTKEIDWQGVRDNAEYLVNKGIKVIVPCGNTSEFYSLTVQEAKEEIKTVVEQVDGRATVIAGIGYAVDTAIELGNYAKDVGADGVMIHMPIHPYITNEGAVDYFKKIIESVDLPSIIYFKNASLSDNVLHQLAPLEKLVGVKYAVNDLPRFAHTVQIANPNHHVTWICGTAEKWAPFFYQAGAKGFTSGLVNVYPEKALALLEALSKNEREAIWALWEEILPFENLRAKYNSGNNVVVVKEAMEQIGLNAGVTREPVATLNKEDKEAVEALIKKWGLKLQAI
ncbi:dihydrodipicolinate synthase family protein [Aquibacillus salsiterrae]|uniref:Dihydrodipicolinate synthase family protein n=1 Tax=Aquibacillus salsiterrae TaxID=2950439 RepID=A0A9X4AFJ3_9BACI|nr:dihydrodipicolinate synthase family protein [Aquibacillus salsiterrae]MDC3416078.1 dihydrodipicolinate synthase family protein [Aquibacillus salsiterrae]